MSSATVALHGVQAPRVRLVPLAVASDAEDAAFLASSYGLTPDEWQESVLEGWLGRRADGQWSAPRCGLAVPRQNGKNGVLEMRELFGMVELGEKFLHTAHEVKTARKAFLRLAGFFENPRKYPELAGLAREIRKTNGQEAISLHNGGSVEFVARSKGSGRGFTVDVLVMDEAQELSEDALAALLPTISAAPSGNPQQIMTGTPPGLNSVGEVFTRVRDTGVAGVDHRLCWLEWSADGGDLDLDDRSLWAATNPALGTRLHWDTLMDERAAFDDETFARERLGVWSVFAAEQVIPLETWAALADPKSEIVGPVAVAISMTLDRSVTSISVAGRRGDGRAHVEVIENRAGTAWVVPRLLGIVERQSPCAVVVDAQDPAASLIPALEENGVTAVKTTASDFAQACGAFYDAAVQDGLRHLSDPLLLAALTGAGKRPLGEGWAWSQKTSRTDITPLKAVTLALHGRAVHGNRPDYDVADSVW